MAPKQSERIRLWGIVQGVGFRPHVAKTAAAFNMKGHVRNTGGLVEITVTDTPKRISAFLHALTETKPSPSEIVHIKRELIDYHEFDEFTITKSNSGNDDTIMIPADLAICSDCLYELYNKQDPRYQHPFISCMVCGPRYTIINDIPYDRDTTSMKEFSMCSLCENEYTDISNRRHHAQTISCHDCGPQLLWKPADVSPISFTSILDNAAHILKSDGVILFKSMGGYNLVANPLSHKAVSKLRHIKKREEKPFAVMFRDVEQIKTFCCMNDIEEKLLESSARPIILLERKDYLEQDFSAELDSKNTELRKSRFIGSFLPSLAAQYLLLDRISPLIFTSANLSDMPMIKDDDEAFSLFEKNHDISGILYNDRKILTRTDDSVTRVIDGQPQMIRRSKGYVPVPLHVDITKAHASNISLSSNASDLSSSVRSSKLLATGSQLKNSFALTKGDFVYMSRFFGDMDTAENQQVYEGELCKLKNMLRIKPKAIVCDMHPLYFTTNFAEKYAILHDIPLLKVQHHHSHVASVMAENHMKGKVIGVSFDGTGYGTDGCIWGGEFLLCEDANMERIAHLPYVNMLGGDSSVKNAVHSALSYIHAYKNKTFSIKEADRTTHSTCSDFASVDISDIIEYGYDRLMSIHGSDIILKGLENNINTVKSSSMGRLFDAVSALLAIKDYNNYEGQCAIMLEDAAAFAQKNPGASKACDMALAFHHSVIDMIFEQCCIAREKYNADQVALTGGTFQNKILMEGILEKLRLNGFKPYYNISVSPNDGGIALGQAYVGLHLL